MEEAQKMLNDALKEHAKWKHMLRTKYGIRIPFEDVSETEERDAQREALSEAA